MESNVIVSLVQAFGPTTTVLLLVIVMLIRERRNNNHKAGNPGSPDVVIGGMNERLSSIQKAVEDLDENSEARHIRIRRSIDEQTAVVAKANGLTQLVYDKVKGSNA